MKVTACIISVSADETVIVSKTVEIIKIIIIGIFKLFIYHKFPSNDTKKLYILLIFNCYEFI